jgi:Fe-S cluster biogenesis protein NfuA
MPSEADAEIVWTHGRIEALLGDLRDQAPAETVAQVEELVDHLVTLYGSALARVTGALDDEDGSVRDVRERIVADPLLSALLLAHGRHPLGVRERVERALARVTPYVASHGGKVVLVEIGEDVVELKLEGACESCSSSKATATELLDGAVREAAPEIARVVVDAGSKAKTHAGAPAALVQLGLKKPQPPATPDDEPAREQRAEERCEMCHEPIGASHDHVTRVGGRELLCVCRACRLLFAHEGATRGKYRPVSDRWFGGDTFALTDLEWARLGIPVRMAFFVVDSVRGTPVGFYPSPGGVVEASIDDDAWSGIERARAAFSALLPDVEAWLVDGRGRDDFDGWIVPLDACYELVARVRMHWSGASGGDEARAKIDEFFASVRDRTAPANAHPGGP